MRRPPPTPPLPTLFEPAPVLGSPVGPVAAAAAPQSDAASFDTPVEIPHERRNSPPPFALSPDPDAADPVDDDNPFGLTNLEALFVTAFTGVAKFNATEAYALAGYSTAGLGATVRSNAANLLKKPRVRRAVHARRRALQALLDGAMEREETLRRLSVIARGDPREVWAHEPLIVALPDHVAACIKSVVRTEQGLRIEMCDRVHALEVIGKWRGMAAEQLDVTLTHRLEDILAASRRLPVVDAEAVAS